MTHEAIRLGKAQISAQARVLLVEYEAWKRAVANDETCSGFYRWREEER